MKQLGINLDWAKDWSQTEIFNDYMKQASKFGKPGTPWIAGGIALDEKGMPLEDFGFVVYRRAPLKSPLNMVMYYKCNGTPKIMAEHHNITITSTTKDSNNITTIKFTVKEGTPQLFLKFLNTNGGVSYLKIFKEGVNEKEAFNSEFINLVSGFGCYRYMELLQTNNSNISKWEERTLPEDSSQNNKGIAWEYVAELSNVTKTDLWINIPHLADDDYIKNLAELLKKSLKYNQNIYVEYSNEMWNGMFTQSGWNVEQARLEVEAGNSNLNYDCKINPNASNKYGWGFRKNARRCREISKIFESVWDKEQINKRVRVVIGGWGAVYYVSSTQLEYLTKNYPDEPVSSYIYGFATGSYYGEGNQIIKNSTSEEEMFKSIEDDLINKEKRYNYKVYKDLADKFKIKTLIYEGGIDITQAGYINKDPIYESREIKRLNFHNNINIKKTVKDILNSYNGELFMWYKASVNDTWGYTIEIKRLDSPIQQALKEYIEENKVKVPFTGTFEVNNMTVVVENGVIMSVK